MMTFGVQYSCASAVTPRGDTRWLNCPCHDSPVGQADSRLHRRSSNASCPQAISIFPDGSPTGLLRPLHLQVNIRIIAKSCNGRSDLVLHAQCHKRQCESELRQLHKYFPSISPHHMPYAYLANLNTLPNQRQKTVHNSQQQFSRLKSQRPQHPNDEPK